MNTLWLNFPIKGMRLLEYREQAADDVVPVDEVAVSLRTAEIVLRAGDAPGEIIIESATPIRTRFDDARRLVLEL